MIAEELQAAGVVGRDQLLQEQTAKQPREHADGKEEAGPTRDPALAVERDAAARDDDMDVRIYAESLVMAGWEQVREISWRFPAVLSHLAVSRSPHNYGLSCSESTTNPRKTSRTKQRRDAAVMKISPAPFRG